MYTNSSNAIALAALVGAVLVARPSLGDMVTIGPSRDTTLISPTGTLSDGSGQFLRVGRVGNMPGGNNTLRRALIAFDVAANLPARSTITAVTMTIAQSKKGPSAISETLTLQRVSISWGEGTSVGNMGGGGLGGAGGTAQPNDATWTHRFFGPTDQRWTTLGGDFVTTVSSQATASNGPFNPVRQLTWPSTAQFVADAQSFLDNPGVNHGWIIRGDEATPFSAILLQSSENPVAANRPRLTITFTPPPPRLTGDVDNDNDVDHVDLALLTQNYGLTATAAGFNVGDFNADLRVSLDDARLLKQNFGRTSPSPEAVPEPAAILHAAVLLLVGGIIARSRRVVGQAKRP